MRACIDGVVYQFQRRGGISRLHNEILPRMCELEPRLRVGIYVGGPCRQPLPVHRRISHYPPAGAYRMFGDGRIARRWAPRLAGASAWFAQRGAGRAIWHSTFYTRPAGRAAAEVVTVVDMIHERFPQLFAGHDHDSFRARKRECILNADAIICISEATREDLLTFCPPATANIHVVPLAHSDAFRVLNGSPTPDDECRPFALYVGDRRGENKNFSGLLEAFADWGPRHDVDLVVAGAAWDESEQCDLARRRLTRRVRLVVDPDDTTLARLYNEAHMLVYPSLYEGFGIPLLEAMACGCPIIASRIPSTVEVAGECAIYFDPADPDSMAAAFDAGHEARADGTRTRAGLERVRRYSWDRAATDTLAVYRSTGSHA